MTSEFWSFNLLCFYYKLNQAFRCCSKLAYNCPFKCWTEFDFKASIYENCLFQSYFLYLRFGSIHERVFSSGLFCSFGLSFLFEIKLILLGLELAFINGFLFYLILLHILQAVVFRLYLVVPFEHYSMISYSTIVYLLCLFC